GGYGNGAAAPAQGPRGPPGANGGGGDKGYQYDPATLAEYERAWAQYYASIGQPPPPGGPGSGAAAGGKPPGPGGPPRAAAGGEGGADVGLLNNCKICLTEYGNRSKSAIIPCGHVACSECIQKSLENSNNTCPFCRGNVQKLQRLYEG
ncbi:hypothetical protein PENTCL1PPCAC_553, partial [Pristionchus entomophagus]